MTGLKQWLTQSSAEESQALKQSSVPSERAT